MTLERAKQELAAAVASLRQEALTLVEDRGMVPLRELLNHLRAANQDDTIISRAIAELLTKNRLHLDFERNVSIPL